MFQLFIKTYSQGGTTSSIQSRKEKEKQLRNDQNNVKFNNDICVANKNCKI